MIQLVSNGKYSVQKYLLSRVPHVDKVSFVFNDMMLEDNDGYLLQFCLFFFLH